jgi:hypothetical protein
MSRERVEKASEQPDTLPQLQSRYKRADSSDVRQRERRVRGKERESRKGKEESGGG